MDKPESIILESLEIHKASKSNKNNMFNEQTVLIKNPLLEVLVSLFWYCNFIANFHKNNVPVILLFLYILVF